MQRKCGKSLKYSKWTPENANLHGNDFIACVDHTKNVLFKQRRYLNYPSKFKRFPLETTNLYRRWLDLWRLYMAIVSKPSKIFITALWSQTMAPCQVSTFFDFFCIFKLFDNEKVHFGCGCTQLFGILPCSFFMNKASTCGEDRKGIFVTIFVQ